MGNPIVGSMFYEIECLATIQEGIQSTPLFTWLNADGNRIVNGDGLTVGSPTASSLSLEFNILRGSDAGRYTCSATLFSLALQEPLTTNSSINLNVQCKQFL